MSDVFERSREALKQYFEQPLLFEKDLGKYNVDKKTLKSSNRQGCLGNGGVPLSTNRSDNNVVVSIDDSDTHTLVFGATGSKKSRLVAMPTVKIIGQALESIIIADPKAEIYERTASDLKKNGYEIFTVNLRNPNVGNGWNPLAIPLSLYRNGKDDMDRAYEFANDIAINLTRVSGGMLTKDPYWENSSASFFFGLIMLLFRMTVDKYIDPKHVNIGNIMRLREEICKNYSFKDKPTAIVEYAKSDSFVSSLLVGTIDTADNTRAGILSTFDQHMRTFAIQPNLLNMLSVDDHILESLLYKPTAIFLIVPDEKTSYHSLVSLFIKQSYEYLIYKHQDAKQSGNEIKQRVNYVLDEFSSLPTISDFPAMITAARSRNIRFMLFVQSKHQLDLRYHEESETIRANCNNWIFLVSRELSLLSELSELSGKRRLKDGAFSHVMNITDLQRLDKSKGEALILSGRKKPYIASLLDIDSYDNGEFESFIQEEQIRQNLSFDFSTLFPDNKKNKNDIFDW